MNNLNSLTEKLPGWLAAKVFQRILIRYKYVTSAEDKKSLLIGKNP
jgi:hypothetical protein